MAKSALQSNDENLIQTAANYCPTLERTGRELQSKAKEAAFHKAEQDRRRNGGLKQGKKKSAASAKEWEPWIIAFNALKALGKTDPIARKNVKKQMTDAGFILKQTGEFPCRRTIESKLR